MFFGFSNLLPSAETGLFATGLKCYVFLRSICSTRPPAVTRLTVHRRPKVAEKKVGNLDPKTQFLRIV